MLYSQPVQHTDTPDALDMLVEAGCSLNRQTDLPGLSTTTLAVLRRWTQAAAGYLYLYQPHHNRLEAAVPPEAGSLDLRYAARAKRIARQALRSLRLVDEARPHRLDEPPEQPERMAWLVVPLADEKGLSGLALLGGGQVETCPVDRMRLLQAFAQQAGMAIRHSREKGQLQAALSQSATRITVGRLLPGLIHEIRNPLTAIDINAQYLEMGSQANPMSRTAARQLLEASNRIREIVDTLGDFSEATRLNWFETDVGQTIEETLLLAAHPLRKDGIELIEQLDQLPEIMASAGHLKLVWLHLLLNAHDAIRQIRPEGGRVTIRANQADPDFVRVQVIDDGTGLQPGIQGDLFQPFFSTKTNGRSGAGLGLYNCALIVRAHQGSITLTNNRHGPGAVATVRLPIRPLVG